MLPALLTREKPAPELMFYWNAFFQLTTDRQLGVSLGPIPWSVINAYAGRYGIADELEFDVLVRLIRAMDGVYLEDLNRRTKMKRE